MDQAFQEPENGQPLPSKSKISNRIRQLVLFEIDDLDDVVSPVQCQFEQQFKVQTAKILVKTFSYQDTKLSSQLAHYLKWALETPKRRPTKVWVQG